ncbi:hypothetical protein GCM10008960_32340 [Deinococcus sedimenti]|uniref:Uncharacterized protein n=1 Tax=Deinococcus sedimenti TaxID=1867090 RepID=A0ABQ2S9P7_9DEIO|nr:hypothetical protein GCM10008960_32340 [Deinococcus sedimenti]
MLKGAGTVTLSRGGGASVGIRMSWPPGVRGPVLLESGCTAIGGAVTVQAECVADAFPGEGEACVQ